jgi:hypothetical protein
MENNKKELKECTGCKEYKAHKDFYKNKLTADGRSNYCVLCTKENAKRYFKRKKEKMAQQESENAVRNALFTSGGGQDTENLMQLLMIEKLAKSLLDEVKVLRESLLKKEIQTVE